MNVYVETVARLREVHRTLVDIDPDYLAVDIETNERNPYVDGARIVLVQLSTGNYHVVIDARRVPQDKLCAFLTIWFNHPCIKIIHNAQFDVSWMCVHLGTPIPAPLVCTMTCERMLTAGRKDQGSDLAATALRRINTHVSKAEQLSFINVGDDNLTPEQLRYAIQDVAILADIVRAQEKAIEKEGLAKVWRLECAVLPIAIKASLFGVAIDLERWRAHIARLEEEAKGMEAELVTALQKYLDRGRKKRRQGHQYISQAEFEEAAGRYEAEADQVYDEFLAKWDSTKRAPWRTEYERIQREQGRKAAAEWRKQNPDPGEGKGEAQKAKRAWKADHAKPEYIGGTINLGSDQQLGIALVELGCALPKTKSGQPSVGKFALKKNEGKFPIVKKLISWGALTKLVQSFGESVLRFADNQARLHPLFNTMGAKATGRFSCNRPNVQQIPNNEKGRELRACFIAGQGYKLVAADYSGQELRLLAEFSQEPSFLWAFANGVDLHSMTAFQMYEEVRQGVGVTQEQMDKAMSMASTNSKALARIKEVLAIIKKDWERKRHDAKTINFGLPYGRTEHGMAEALGVDLETAKAIVDAYYVANPYIKAWLDRTAAEGMSRMYVQTPLGRKRFFKNLSEYDFPMVRRMRRSYERAMKNMPIQGGGADITKMAMVLIDKELTARGFDAIIVLTVHDEIVVQAREDQAEQVAELVVEQMKRAGRVILKTVPVEVEVKIGDHWEH